MALRPFQGARDPPPLAYLDQALPTPHSAFDRAAEPILRAVLAEGDVPPQKYVMTFNRWRARETISASMTDSHDKVEVQEILPGPYEQDTDEPGQVYIEDFMFDMHFSFGAPTIAPPVSSFSQASIILPPDKKMGLRVLMIETDEVGGVVPEQVGVEVRAAPTLRDLLVEPASRPATYDRNGLETTDENLFISGPTSTSQYYSALRPSLDKIPPGELVDVGYDALPHPAPTSGWLEKEMREVDGTGDVFTNGDRVLDGDDIRFLHRSAPAPCCYRVLYDRKFECDPCWRMVGSPGFRLANGTGPGAFGTMNDPYYSGMFPEYHMRCRDTIPMKRTYNWGQTAIDDANGEVFTSYRNTRRIFMFLIPKSTSVATRNANGTGSILSVYPVMSPVFHWGELTVRLAARLQEEQLAQMFGYVDRTDRWLSGSEVQGCANGHRMIDTGKVSSKAQRRDRRI